MKRTIIEVVRLVDYVCFVPEISHSPLGIRTHAAACAVLVGVMTCLSTGCARVPAFAPPEQKQELAVEEPPIRAPIVVLAAKPSPARVVADILPRDASSDYGWTNQHPRVQCWLEDDGPWTLSAELYTANDVLKVAGSQELTFKVNDVTVGKARLDQVKEYILEYRVPPSALASRQPVLAGFDIDRVLVAPDGTKYGVLVKSIGFRRDSR